MDNFRVIATAVTVIVCFFLLWWMDVLSVGMLLLLVVLLTAAAIIGDRLSILLPLIPLSMLIPEPGNFPIGFTTKLYIGRFFIYDISATEIVIVLLGFVALFALLWNRNDIPLPSALERWILAFLVLSVLSVFWVVDQGKFLVAVRLYSYHVLAFFFGVLLVRKRYELRWVMNALSATLLILAGQTLTVLAGLGSINKLLVTRNEVRTPVGFLAFALALIVLLWPMVYANARTSHGFWQVVSWLGLGLGALTVVVGLGKAALLSLLLAFLWLSFRQKTLRTSVKLLAVGALLMVVLQSSGVGTPTELLYRLTRSFSDVSTQFRVQEYQTGLDIFFTHPFVGVGAGNLKVWYGRYLNGYVGESNNVLIQIAAENGVLGLTVIAGIIWCAFFLVRRLRRSIQTRTDEALVAGFEAMLLAASLHSMLEVTFIGLFYGILFWLMVGVMVAYEKMVEGRGLTAA